MNEKSFKVRKVLNSQLDVNMWLSRYKIYRRFTELSCEINEYFLSPTHLDRALCVHVDVVFTLGQNWRKSGKISVTKRLHNIW